MLDTTLSMTFLPGTNLKGKVAGGNWTFVLPSLDLGQVICLGVPSTATLSTLSRHANEVVVICRHDQRAIGTDVLRRLRVDNISLLVTSAIEKYDVAPKGADLIFIADNLGLFRIALSAQLRSLLKGWLSPSGKLYFEMPDLASRFVTRLLCGQGATRFGKHEKIWLTPLGGESHTFVPLLDRITMGHFLGKGLLSKSLRSDTLKKVQSRARLLPRGTASKNPSIAKLNESSQGRGGGTLRARTKSAVHRTIRFAVGIANQCEQFLNTPNGLGMLLGRRGVFVSKTNSATSSPPQYLCELARQSGIAIDSYRWGLSASGDYDSRKLVFFLFPKTESVPQFVVKMTRSGLFNVRLNRELQALQQLEEKGIGDRETLPRIVFAGVHGGLTVVGETAIEGVPFDRRTTATASCPYARAAIDWLTELGAVTANPLAAQPSEVASELRRLLSRFSELYRPCTDHHGFLNAQVDAMAFNQVPLVFQHGDPGRWNVLVTPQGRISFLDWEAAESRGMPLWDLFYFLRSFCVCVAQNETHQDSLSSLDKFFLSDSAVSELALESVSNYCVESGLAGHLVEPLFYLCWMHRALKEATRLEPHKLSEGHYFRFLQRCIDKRDTSVLRRLFSLP